MKSEASAELLAPIEDVWSFLSEPYNLSDWWPNIGGVQPDRRGFAEQARWTLIRGAEPGLLQKPSARRMLVVTGVEPYKRFAFNLPSDRLDVELALAPVGHDHTQATLSIRGPFLLGFRRPVMAAQILERIHDRIQTAAAE